MPPATYDAFPAVIIGGGLAGLTAALALAERGLPPLVLEADAACPGGRLSGGAPDTFDFAGRTWSFPPDHGVHALWGQYHNTRALLDRLGVERRLSIGEDWIDRWGREVRRVEAGTLVRYSWLGAPFHYLMLLLRPKFWPTITPLDFLSLPGYLASTLLTVGLDPIAERRPLPGLLLSEYFRGWTRNLRVTFVGLARNLLAAPEEHISLSAFIAALRFYTMLRRDAWTMEFLPGDSHTHLVQPLIDRIQSLAGIFMPGVEALSLSRAGDHWHLTVDDKPRGGRRSLHADRVILAVDPPAAQRLLNASQLPSPRPPSRRPSPLPEGEGLPGSSSGSRRQSQLETPVLLDDRLSPAQTNGSLSVDGEGMEAAWPGRVRLDGEVADATWSGRVRSGFSPLPQGEGQADRRSDRVRVTGVSLPTALPNIAVRLWFDRAPDSGAPAGMFTGDFPMDNFFWLHRLYDAFKPWHDTTGGAVLETHLYGKGNLFDLTDEALLIRVVSEVTLAFPSLRGGFVHGTVRRNSRTQTLFEVPTDHSLAVDTPWPDLYACGDWIAHPTPALNMERSVVTALAAANHILNAHELSPYPILPPDPPEIMARVLSALIRAGRWLLGPPITAALRALHRLR